MNMKKYLTIAGLSLFLVGCGESGSIEEKSSTNLPEQYSYKVINNRGLVVEGKLDSYKIKIYSDNEGSANPKDIHKGVVVKVNGKSSETMPIEISYLNKNIIVVIYDESGKEVAVSEEIQVSDVPVLIVELSI